MTTLSDKIDSLEKYLEATYTVHGQPAKIAANYELSGGRLLAPALVKGAIYQPQLPVITGTAFTGFSGRDTWPDHLWWLHREYMRLATSVYAISPTIATLNASNAHITQYALHVSREDTDKIAWTPTVEDGQRDRQVAMSLGRWLRRVFPALSDPEVAAIEASHRMHMNPDVEFVDFTTDIDKAINAYMGVTSCMSKSKDHWGAGHHPLEAYMAPGFKLAVMYGVSKKISGRCIVWINPENAEDKRAVRNYGDDSLRMYLKSKGFVFSNLGGAYLKAILVKNDTHIMMPYVDTAACEVRPNTSVYGVYDGDGKVWLFDEKTIAKIPKEALTGIQTQHGFTAAKPFPLNAECVVTKKKINYARDTISIVYADGQRAQALSNHIGGWKSGVVVNRGGVLTLPLHPGTPTFTEAGTTYVDNDETRTALSYIKLDAELYPEATQWVKKTSSFMMSSNGKFIKEVDAVYFIVGGLKTTIHRSQLPSDAVRVAQVEERKTFAAAGSDVKITAANRKVVPGVHDVVEGYNGVWGYRRSMREMTSWGRTVWVPATMTPEELMSQVDNVPESVKNDIRRNVAKGHNREALIRHQIFTVLNDRGDCLSLKTVDDNTIRWVYHFEPRDLDIALIERVIADPSLNPPGSANANALAQMKKIIEVVDGVLAESTAPVAEPA